ncbi:hypothetical protein [Paenarthrobacter histidinolovorans]|uniref:hypothetical protein n=1 Tax=Paenarthrobacter histidinolovorans TaxID=43664 RepID=UPI0016649966|nr:hypothetical protein [Paenarthrobacter histidinolovorans]
MHTSFQAEISPAYNEVLNEIAGRIRESSSIGRSDIGALAFCTRLRADTPWVTEIMWLPERHTSGQPQPRPWPPSMTLL